MHWNRYAIYLISLFCLAYSAWGDEVPFPSTETGEGLSSEEVQEAPAPAPPSLEARFDIITCWEGGLQATITLINVGDVAIEDWSMEFEYPLHIHAAWNAILQEGENETAYRVLPRGDSARLEVGEKLEIGFNACPGDIQALLTLISVNGVQLPQPKALKPAENNKAPPAQEPNKATPGPMDQDWV